MKSTPSALGPRLVRATALLIACASLPAHASLEGYYEFGDTSGTTLVDSSGNGRDGSVVGTGDLNVSGIVGSGYQPGGDGAYGVVTNGATDFGITGNTPRTISLWFNTPSFGGTTDQHRLVGFGTGAASSFDIVAESGTNAGGAPRVGLRYGNGNVYFDSDNSGTPFAINTWYHLAVVYDGTTLDLETIGTASDGKGLIFYINGVEVNTAGGNLGNPTQALTTATGDFFLGSGLSASHDLYPGLLDEMQVYSRALNPSEVLGLYEGVVGETLLSSAFDANTGATVLGAGSDNTSGTTALTINDWTTASKVSAISGLTAISTGDSGTLGGFAVLQGGSATYANTNVVFINRNLNLDSDRTTSQRGFSFDFTLADTTDLLDLTLLSGHTNSDGTLDQGNSSDLVVELSGGSLGSPVSLSTTVDYGVAPAYRTISFDLSGTTLDPGTYSVSLYQSDLTGGGAYATFNGISMTSAVQASETLIASAFDANAGATVLGAGSDNTSGTTALTINDWNTASKVSAISGLTAISTGDSGTLGGFAVLQGGSATYANTGVVFISRNHNLDADRTTSQRGYSFDFTLAESADLRVLTLLSGHTNSEGTLDQGFTSELVVELSGGTLGSPQSWSTTVDYNTVAGAPYRSVSFDLNGTALGAGTYTLVAYQSNMPGGGAYATFNGIYLTSTADTVTPVAVEDPEIVGVGFNGAAFEVTATKLNSSTSYVLKRSATLNDGFPAVVDGPRLPTADGTPETDTFSDPSPPSGAAYYKVEEAP